MVGTTEAANLLGISPRRLRYLLQADRVFGAFKVGRTWVIPLVNGMPLIKTRKRGPKATWKKPESPPSLYGVHVNSTIFGKKDKDGNYVPVITVKRGSENIYGRRVVIPGPCTVVYDYDNGRWGAKSWIETYEQPIIVGDRFTFAEIQASMAAST
ncbi:MAG: helix-turn-helix domain-containing protein [Nostocaceae cyanobacterium]|nr:helix-turn-helix domain-containing protein [Nostocaceae cyanobacterium]